MRADLAILEVKLGHRFTQSESAAPRAHPQFAGQRNAWRQRTLSDNDSWSFLGDAVLGMVVSDVLFRRFPLFKEGELSTVKARIGQRRALARRLPAASISANISKLGRGEEMSGGAFQGKRCLWTLWKPSSQPFTWMAVSDRPAGSLSSR
jgi:ribonuclease-3